MFVHKIYDTRGEHTNHDTTNEVYNFWAKILVYQKLKWYCIIYGKFKNIMHDTVIITISIDWLLFNVKHTLFSYIIYDDIILIWFDWFDLLCLTPLSAIF